MIGLLNIPHCPVLGMQCFCMNQHEAAVGLENLYLQVWLCFSFSLKLKGNMLLRVFNKFYDTKGRWDPFKTHGKVSLKKCILVNLK